MNINSINTKHVKVPLGKGRGGSGATDVEVILAEVTTEEGLTGTGFTYALTGGASGVKKLIDDTLAEVMVGRSLLEWDMLWHAMWDKTHRLGKGVSLLAISALDIAVWD